MLNRNKIEFNDNKKVNNLFKKESQKNNKKKIYLYIIYRLWFAWGKTWTKVFFNSLIQKKLCDVGKLSTQVFPCRCCKINFLFGKHQGNKLKDFFFISFFFFQFSFPNNILTALTESEKVITIIIKNFVCICSKKYTKKTRRHSLYYEHDVGNKRLLTISLS